MFEISSLKAAHHQTSTIEHLKYQNQLLVKRNQLLAQENQKLVNELDLAHKKMQMYQEKQIQYLIKQKQALIKTAKIDFESNFTNLDGKLLKHIRKSVSQYKKILQNQPDSFANIYNCLIQIINKLIESTSLQKNQNLRDLISNASARLIQRKYAKENCQNIIHLIKEPSDQLQGLQYRTIKEQLNTQRQFYQKIIRKITKSNTQSQVLGACYKKIDDLMGLRWKMKQQEARLSSYERQLELGNFNTQSQLNSSQNLKFLKNDILEVKRQLTSYFDLLK